MSSGIPSLSERSGGLLIFPKVFHLWIMGIPLCIGTCLVSLYFRQVGLTYIPENIRILGGIIGVSIFTYVTAPLAGYVMWMHPQTRLGFSMYWALMAGLGAGWVLGPVFGLGTGAIMLVGLYLMEHLLIRPGFIGGIFDGLFAAFAMSGLYLSLAIVISLLAFHQVLHPWVLLITCAFGVSARLLGTMFIRVTKGKRKQKFQLTWSYKLGCIIFRTFMYAGLAMLIFLDAQYLVIGLCFGLLMTVAEFAPKVRKPVEIDDSIIQSPDDL